jgi:TFIIF-interacting CTD phosphatase-like protein
MKQKTMQELNEQYKDCPQREREYTIHGQKIIVVSHFIGDKDLDNELYCLAFDKALNEVLSKPVQSCESV